jgi:membrane protein YqaA with SNARE-associated domain
MAEFFTPGYLSLFTAAFFAATVLPLGSEFLFTTMVYSGYDFTICLAAASIGNTLGGMTSFALGFFVKWEWLEKYMNISMERVKSLQVKIGDRIAFAALLCWLPVVGDPLAVTLGFMKAPALRVSLFMFAGKFLRYYILALSVLKVIDI